MDLVGFQGVAGDGFGEWRGLRKLPSLARPDSRGGCPYVNCDGV